MEFDYCSLMFGYLEGSEVKPYTTEITQKYTYGITYNNLEGNEQARAYRNGVPDQSRGMTQSKSKKQLPLSIITEFGQVESPSGSEDQVFHLQQRGDWVSLGFTPSTEYWPKAYSTEIYGVRRNIMPFLIVTGKPSHLVVR